jgi:hypothetical protein
MTPADDLALECYFAIGDFSTTSGNRHGLSTNPRGRSRLCRLLLGRTVSVAANFQE